LPTERGQNNADLQRKLMIEQHELPLWYLHTLLVSSFSIGNIICCTNFIPSDSKV